MRANLFWLNDEQWAKIEPLIPMNRPGPKPQNTRRILSGIIHVLRSGCRWQDCPPEYGPYTTVYNRFNRGSVESGNRSSREWQVNRSRPNRWRWTARMSKRTAAPVEEKGGLGTGDWCHEAWAQQQDPRACRQVLSSVGNHSDARQHSRLHGGAGMHDPDGRQHPEAARRQGL
jgi:transposase